MHTERFLNSSSAGTDAMQLSAVFDDVLLILSVALAALLVGSTCSNSAARVACFHTVLMPLSSQCKAKPRSSPFVLKREQLNDFQAKPRALTDSLHHQRLAKTLRLARTRLVHKLLQEHLQISGHNRL